MKKKKNETLLEINLRNSNNKNLTLHPNLNKENKITATTEKKRKTATTTITAITTKKNNCTRTFLTTVKTSKYLIKLGRPKNWFWPKNFEESRIYTFFSYFYRKCYYFSHIIPKRVSKNISSVTYVIWIVQL